MISLHDVKKVIDQLSKDDQLELLDYIQKHMMVSAPHQMSPEDRIRRLNDATKALRDGLSQDELDDMIAAMNEDYIEVWDESEWTD